MVVDAVLTAISRRDGHHFIQIIAPVEQRIDADGAIRVLKS